MRNGTRLGILVAVVALLNGCISPDRLKAMSAGQTGCVPDTIDVSKPQAVTGGLMWNATCNGKQYLCTTIESGKNASQTSCAIAAQ